MEKKSKSHKILFHKKISKRGMSYHIIFDSEVKEVELHFRILFNDNLYFIKTVYHSSTNSGTRFILNYKDFRPVKEKNIVFLQ